MNNNELGILLSAIIDKVDSERKINKVIKQIEVEAVKLNIQIDDKMAKSIAKDFTKQLANEQKKMQKEIEDSYKLLADEKVRQEKSAYAEKSRLEKQELAEQKKMAQEIAAYEKQLANEQKKIQAQLNKYKNEPNYFKTQENKAKKLGIDQKELTALKKARDLWGEISNEDFKNLDVGQQTTKLEEYKNALAQVADQMRLLSGEKGLAKSKTSFDTQSNNLERQIRSYVNINKRLEGTKQGTDLNNILKGFEAGGVNKGNIDNVSSSFSRIRKESNALGLEGQNMWDKLTGKYAEYGRFLLVSGSIALLRKSLGEAIQVVKELDKAFVNLQMVTGGTAAQTANLMQSYNQMAQKLGATTAEIATAGNEFLRQGLSIADTNKLIEASTILSKVGMLSSAEATQYLTSAMKGYGVSVSDTLNIVDKLSAVDMESATSAGGLAEAMSKTATSAKLAGIEMDKLLGMLAATAEVTQADMASVGTAYKTIFARMSNIKLGKLEDEDGESISEYLSDAEQALDRVDIKLRKSATEFNNFGDIFDQLGSKWKQLSQVDQNVIATAFSGTRQKENFLVLMENYDKAIQYSQTATNSFGTASEKMGYYQEGIEARTKAMTAAFESLSQNLINSGLVKILISFGTGVLKILDNGFVRLIATLALVPLATKGVIMAFTALKGSTLVYTASQYALMVASNGLIVTLKALWATMAASPLFWITAAVVAIGAAVKAFNYFAKAQERAQEALSNSIQEYEEAKNKVAELEEELKNVSDRIKEIETLEIADDKELTKLQAQRQELELMLEVQRELESIKNKEVSDNAVKSISTKSEDSSAVGYSNPFGITRAEKLAENEEMYSNLDRRIQGVLQGDLSAEKKAKEIEKLKYVQDQLKKSSIELANALMEEAKALDRTDPEADKLFNDIQDGVKGTLEWAKSTDGATKATNKFHDEASVVVDKLYPKMSGSLEDLEKSFKDYKAILADINNGNGLSAQSMVDIIEKYPELIQYLNDETRLKEELIKISYDEEGQYKKLVQSKIEGNSEFYKNSVLTNSELVDDFSEQYGIDLSNYKNFEELKEQVKNVLAQNLALINESNIETLANQYGVDLENFSTMEEKKVAVAKAAAGAMVKAYGYMQGYSREGIKIQLDLLKKNPFNKFNPIYDSQVSELESWLAVSGASVDDILNKIDAITSSYVPKSFDIGDLDKKTSSPYRSELNEQLIEKDRYYEINNKIIKSENELLKIKSEQDDLNENEVENAERLIQLYNDESKSLKEKQGLLHDLNEERRREREEISSNLSSYGISTSGEGDSMSLANYAEIEENMRNRVNSLRASKNKEAYTNAKDEYDKLVTLSKRFFEIQLTDLPKTSEEWFKLAKEINKTKDNIIKTNEAVYDDRLSQSKKYIDEKNFYDNWGADNEILAWERVKAYTEQLYAEGKISHEKYIAEISEINKSIYSSQQKQLEEYYGAAISLIDEQKERLQKLRDSEEKYWDDRISNLQKSNEEQEKAIELAQLEERLANQRKENTKRVWSESARDWIWTTDKEAIKDTEKQIGDMRKGQEIAELERQRDKELRNWDKQIKDVERVQNAWEKIVKDIENNKRDALLKSILGDNWDTNILKTFDGLKKYVSDYTGINGEIIPVTSNSGVLSNSNSSRYTPIKPLEMLGKMLTPLTNLSPLANMFKTPALPNMVNNTQNLAPTENYNFHGNIIVPDVQNPKQFVSGLKNTVMLIGGNGSRQHR